jgi:acetolactate synthase I/II/III large subunit
VQGAEFVVRALQTEGIDHVFMGLGGLDDPFMTPITGVPGITPVVAAHEGGAAYMADGYARASGRFGVALGIGGPGILNMTTAVASAHADRSGIVLLSGEVPTSWEGMGGFQDASGAALDDAAVLRPLTAASVSVESPATLDHHLRVAVTTACTDANPVHLAIPRDVQTAEIAGMWTPRPAHLLDAAPLDLAGAEAVVRALTGDGGAPGQTIVVLAGPGVVSSDATEDLVRVAEAFNWPVATTLHAKGVMPEDHRLALGVFGYAGSRHAIEAVLADDVDVLIVLGTALSQRDTLFWDRRMLPRRALVHVDADPRNIGRTWPTEAPVVGDCGAFLRYLLAVDGEPRRQIEAGREARTTWVEGIRASGSSFYEPEHMTDDQVPIHPARVIAELRHAAPRDTVLVPDSGAHRAWCAHYWTAYGPRQYLTATNLGPMGAAIPLGIGAKAARPDSPCVVVTGDGCMLMHGIEIHTAVQHHVPIVVVVMNNHAYGNIWFRAHAMGPGPESLTEIRDVDWATFARSLGAESLVVNQPAELGPAFTRALEARRPVIVDVHIDKTARTPVTPWQTAAQQWEHDT